MKDLQLRVITANMAFVRAAGANSVTELIGKTSEEIFGNSQEKETIKSYAVNELKAQALPPGEQIECEGTLIYPDGKKYIFSARWFPIFDSDGTLIATANISTDITRLKEAEEELRKSEEKFRGLFENSLSGVSIHEIILDEHGNPVDFIFREVNKAFEKQTGFKASDVLGKHAADVFPGIEKTSFIETCGKVILTGVPVDYEQFFESINRYYHISAYKLSEHRFVTVFQDVTERKQAEDKIYHGYVRESAINEILRLSFKDLPIERLLENALDLILELSDFELENTGAVFLVEDDPDCLVLKASRGLAEPLLHKCAHVPFGKCLCGRAASTEKVVFANGVDERHEIHYEGMHSHGHYCVPLQFKNHTIGVLNLYVQEGHTRSAKLEQFLVSSANALSVMIARKQAEEKIAEEAIRRRIFIDGSRDGIIVLDLNGRVFETNPKFAQILGYSVEEALKLHVWDWDVQFTREELLEMLKDTDEAGAFFDTKMRRKDGTVIDVDVSATGVTSGGQKLIFCICGDITERKQAEEALRENRAL
ncbi:MAG: PAS domain S-box protein, partial [Methanolobus sp.]|nr:PAS domain S-box protein [Methanolobus sp.]